MPRRPKSSALLKCGWYQKGNGKEVAIHYQSVNGDIGYRYKGTRQIRNTSRESFMRRFANSATPRQ